MAQRLGGKDCPRPCAGRDRDKAGKRIPCEHNGFVGVPLARLVEYGRTALKEGYRRDLSPGVDKTRWKAPSLKIEGRPFKPSNAVAGVPVGSLLSWDEQVQAYSETGVDINGEPLKIGLKTVRRSGQVWSGHWRPGVVWVAPEDGGSAVALNVKTLEVERY